MSMEDVKSESTSSLARARSTQEQLEEELGEDEVSSSSSPTRTSATHTRRRRYKPKNVFSSVLRRECGISTLYGDRECFVRRLELLSELKGHTGCVNTIRWNDRGNLVCSGSDDCKINIWDVENHSSADRSLKLSFTSGHEGNIFHVVFVPTTNDEQVISCAADGQIRYSNLPRKKIRTFTCHSGMVHKLAPVEPHPHVFLSSSEDATIRMFDMREKHACVNNPMSTRECENSIVKLRGDASRQIGIHSFAVHPNNNHEFVTVGRDNYVRMFDRRRLTRKLDASDARPCALFTPRELDEKKEDDNSSMFFRSGGATGVAYSNSGDQLVATYSDEDIFLFDSQHSMLRSCRPLHSPHEATPVFNMHLAPPLAAGLSPTASGNGSGSGGEHSTRMDDDDSNSIDDVAGYDANANLNLESGSRSNSVDNEPKPLSAPSDNSSCVTDSPAGSASATSAASGSDSSPASSNLSAAPEGSLSGASASVPATNSEDAAANDEDSDDEDSDDGLVLMRPLQEAAPNSSDDEDDEDDSESDGEHSHTFVVESDAPLSSRRASVFERRRRERGPGYRPLSSWQYRWHLRRDRREALEKEREEEKKKEEGGGKGEQRIRMKAKKNQERRSASSAEASSSSSSSSALPAAASASSSSSAADGDTEMKSEKRRDESYSGDDEHISKKRRTSCDTPAPDSYFDVTRGPFYERRSFTGHTNSRTVKEVNFFGRNSEFIISGSDDGHIYIWRKSDGQLVQCLSGDRSVVNCVQPNPIYGGITLATSGIEDHVKLWSPTAQKMKSVEELDRFMDEARTSRRGQSSRATGIPIELLWMLMQRYNRDDDDDDDF